MVKPFNEFSAMAYSLASAEPARPYVIFGRNIPKVGDGGYRDTWKTLDDALRSASMYEKVDQLIDIRTGEVEFEIHTRIVRCFSETERPSVAEENKEALTECMDAIYEARLRL